MQAVFRSALTLAAALCPPNQEVTHAAAAMHAAVHRKIGSRWMTSAHDDETSQHQPRLAPLTMAIHMRKRVHGSGQAMLQAPDPGGD